MATYRKRKSLGSWCPICGEQYRNDYFCKCSAMHVGRQAKVSATWDAAKARARFARPEGFEEPDVLTMASARSGLSSGGIRNAAHGGKSAS